MVFDPAAGARRINWGRNGPEHVGRSTGERTSCRSESLTRSAESVILFAPAEDGHAGTVERALISRGASVARIDLSAVVERVSIDPGRAVQINDMVLAPGVPVWWRRTGVVPYEPTLTEFENQLRREESEALLLGGLMALTDRWVDHPYVVMSAEHTVKQLAVARAAGARVPETIATNDPSRAASMHSVAGPLVAKATSAGVGIAPFADLVGPEAFELLRPCITLLQQAQDASADLRVVIIGDVVMVWGRPRRDDEDLDWRAADPRGRGFVRCENHAVATLAVSINRHLSLLFSVQDWLLVDGEPVFLEVNPSGQWLFLAGADECVSSALADLLIEQRSP